MDRTVQHTLHVSLGFDETCARIEKRCQELLDRATTVAATTIRRRTETLLASKTQDLPWATAHPLVREAGHHATMALDWQATHPSNRLLPHLDAHLVINGVILRGPHASTAISILGSFDPSTGLLRRIDDVLFRRRLVDEATEAFLGAFVTALLDRPLDVRTEKIIEAEDSTRAAS